MRVNLAELHTQVWEHVRSVELDSDEGTVQMAVDATLRFLVPHIKAGEEEACRMGCDLTMKMMLGLGE